MSSSVAVGDSLQVPNSLSYIREPQHRLIIDLLKLTTTEVVTSTTRIVPPSPSHVSLRSTTDVNNSPADCRPNESESVQQQKRFLLSNGFCCCELAMQTGCIGEELGAGWKLNEINVTSLSTHCLDSRPSPLDWKSESLISVAKSGTKLDSTSFLGKTSSTGKIDTGAVRYSRGYPYQKDAIPFRFQHFEDDVAAMNIDLYRESYTYPSLEDHLKSIDGRSSSPASSVVVPKLLVLGISKPGAGASDIHQPHYNRQPKISSTQSTSPHTTSAMYGDKYRQRHSQSLQLGPSLPLKPTPHSNFSTNPLEVHHGQSEPHQLNHLPCPDVLDSLPLLPKTSTVLGHRHDNRQAHQFRDILSFDDTRNFHQQRKSTVMWASNKFPERPVNSVKQCDTADSLPASSSPASQPPGQRKMFSKSFNGFYSSKHAAHGNLKTASFPRPSNKHTDTNKRHSQLGIADLPRAPILSPALLVTGKAGSAKSMSYQHQYGQVLNKLLTSKENFPAAPVTGQGRTSKESEDTCPACQPQSLL